jgi:polyketide cyclase/dehydrase/lipid transport protein
MKGFALVSRWSLDAPIEAVWEAIYDSDHWPQWWKYVRSVREIQKGDSSGVGAIRRFTWTSRLPYSLTFDMRTTVVERPYRLEGEAIGELVGSGRWSLTRLGSVTEVRYTWEVATTRAWMNAMAPLLAPAFKWNHNQVMAEGGRALARVLGVRLLAST